MNVSRYFIKTNSKDEPVAIGKTDGATYPDMKETDESAYNNARNKLDDGQA